MKRRGFLGLIGSLVAAPVAATLPTTPSVFPKGLLKDAGPAPPREDFIAGFEDRSILAGGVTIISPGSGYTTAPLVTVAGDLGWKPAGLDARWWQ